MVTMEDIARRLGITKGTVSKAINGATDVSETTRKAVLEAAVELGYTKLPRTGTQERLCVFVENMAWEKPDDFGYDLIISFRKAAEPAGFPVDIVPLDVQTQRSSPYEEYMMSGHYRGAFFLGLTLMDPWMRDFRTSRTPAVLYDNWIRANPTVAHVGVNNYEAMELSVSRLQELGHRKIGYLGAALGSYVYQDRYKAFFQALRQHQLDDNHSLTGVSYYTSECLSRHLPRLLKNGCTAIICSHDLLAHSVMIHCSECGLKIPDDLSIIGFDDIPLCRYTVPPLTTIRQDRVSLGKSAFFALNSLINQVPVSTLQLHAELIQRESIGPAPSHPAVLKEPEAS